MSFQILTFSKCRTKYKNTFVCTVGRSVRSKISRHIEKIITEGTFKTEDSPKLCIDDQDPEVATKKTQADFYCKAVG